MDPVAANKKPRIDVVSSPPTPVVSTLENVFVPNPQAVVMLTGMGFSEAHAINALRATNNHLENAADWIVINAEEPAQGGQLAGLPSSSSSNAAPQGSLPNGNVDPQSVAVLTSMGFTGSQAVRALKVNNNHLEQAIDWVVGHAEELTEEEPPLVSSPVVASTLVALPASRSVTAATKKNARNSALKKNPNNQSSSNNGAIASIAATTSTALTTSSIPAAPKTVSATTTPTGLSPGLYIRRIHKELNILREDPPPGIHIHQDEQDMMVVHVLIVGPDGTPYEKGFFYVVLRLPPDYPWKPPQAKFMTTGGGKVRFNPNLYACGKVCLSILGTWTGPSWSQGMTLSTVLLSIQSLMCEKPYHNEPGYDKERVKGDSKKYNDVILHETIRVAVIGAVSNKYLLNMPEPLADIMKSLFVEFYNYYDSVCKKLSSSNLQNRAMDDPFSCNSGTFNYKQLSTQLNIVYKQQNR